MCSIRKCKRKPLYDVILRVNDGWDHTVDASICYICKLRMEGSDEVNEFRDLIVRRVNARMDLSLKCEDCTIIFKVK